jgi:hypothetical protein
VAVGWHEAPAATIVYEERSVTYPQPKKSSTGLIIGVMVATATVLCGGILVLGALVSNRDGQSTTSSGDFNEGTDEADQPRSAKLNQSARDGKFEFTVTRVQCGIAQVGGDYLNERAQGQFCKVFMTVKNIGDEARTFSASNQYAYNAAGARYDADGAAAFYLGEDSNAFLEGINPGNSVKGILLFDIPKNAKIVRLELHDSPFSGGVMVSV